MFRCVCVYFMYYIYTCTYTRIYIMYYKVSIVKGETKKYTLHVICICMSGVTGFVWFEYLCGYMLEKNKVYQAL